MRGLNNPHKTYGTEVEDSDFELDLESDDVDKFMNNTVECAFSNLEIINQTASKPSQEAPFTGDNSTIEMGASLAYTHFSDKTQSSDKNNTTQPAVPVNAATQLAPDRETNAVLQEPSSNQSHETIGIVSEGSTVVDLSSISSITMNSGPTQDIIKEAAKNSPNIQNALASSLFDVNDISNFFTEIFQQMIPPSNHPGGAEAPEAGNKP